MFGLRPKTFVLVILKLPILLIIYSLYHLYQLDVFWLGEDERGGEIETVKEERVSERKDREINKEGMEEIRGACIKRRQIKFNVRECGR